MQGNLVFSQTAIPPFSNSVSYESCNLGNPTAAPPPLQGVLCGINSTATNLQPPVVYDFSLTLERELPEGNFIRVAYAGKLILMRHLDINFPSFDALVANNNIPSATRQLHRCHPPRRFVQHHEPRQLPRPAGHNQQQQLRNRNRLRPRP